MRRDLEDIAVGGLVAALPIWTGCNGLMDRFWIAMMAALLIEWYRCGRHTC